ncbi:hypothetical protein [Streptomyces lanatus]|uniref:Uncharacterized protein n=1 Tax=Streptomyces lanatus TaxID=66900 RepID=A0ABV1XY01_9ACTN|nr:hypothetical protein [Streptomyces lanatus]GHH17614.1 hypothetical protein GCM10018780_61270 [Streptomyces lanatus]
MSEADNGDGIPEELREDVVRDLARTPVPAVVTACVLQAALLDAGCGGHGDEGTATCGRATSSRRRPEDRIPSWTPP